MNFEPSRKKYLRSLYVCIFFTFLGEASIFVIFGLYLFPDGNLLYKALWTLLFCGVGMGAVLGGLLNIFVVNKARSPQKAIIITIAFSFVLLGVGCNLLCLNLDLTFGYFGVHSNPLFFFFNGLGLSAVGGLIIGSLLFTQKGGELLNKIGL